jgi:hypothetical protein
MDCARRSGLQVAWRTPCWLSLQCSLCAFNISNDARACFFVEAFGVALQSICGVYSVISGLPRLNLLLLFADIQKCVESPFNVFYNDGFIVN